jgi:hypothetical protein
MACDPGVQGARRAGCVLIVAGHWARPARQDRCGLAPTFTPVASHDDDEEEMYLADGSDFDENADPVSEFKGASPPPPCTSRGHPHPVTSLPVPCFPTHFGGGGVVLTCVCGLCGAAGVTWSARRRKWSASLTAGTGQVFLGYHSDEEKAARAYDRGSRCHEGQYAGLNFLPRTRRLSSRRGSEDQEPKPKPRSPAKGKGKAPGKGRGRAPGKGKGKGKGKRGRAADTSDDDDEIEAASSFALRDDHPGLLYSASLARFLDHHPAAARELLVGPCITDVGRQLEQRLAWDQGDRVGSPPSGVANLAEAFLAWWTRAAAPTIKEALGIRDLDTPALAKEGCFFPPLGADVRILQLMCEAHGHSVMRPGGKAENLSAAVIASVREACLDDPSIPFLMPLNVHLATCIKEGNGAIWEPCYSHKRGGHLAARTAAFRFAFSGFATLAGFAGCRLDSIVVMESQSDILELGATPLHEAGRAFLRLDEKGPPLSVRPAEHPACLHEEESRHLALVARILAREVHAVAGNEAASRVYAGVVSRLHERGFLTKLSEEWPGHPTLPPPELGPGSDSLAARDAVVQRVLELEMQRMGVGSGDEAVRQAFLARAPRLEAAIEADSLVAAGLQQPVFLDPDDFLAEEKRLTSLYELEPAAQAEVMAKVERPSMAFSGVLGTIASGVVAALDWYTMCTAPRGLAQDWGGGPVWTLQEAVGPARLASGLEGEADPRQTLDVAERGREVKEALTETGIFMFDIFGENDGLGPIRANKLRSPSAEAMRCVGSHRLTLLLRAGKASGMVLDILLLTEMEEELVLALLEPGGEDLGEGVCVLEHVDVSDIHLKAELELLGVYYGRRKVLLISYNTDGSQHAIRFHFLAHLNYEAVAALGKGLRGVLPETTFSYFKGPLYAATCWVRARRGLPDALPHPADPACPMRPRDVGALLSELGE